MIYEAAQGSLPMSTLVAVGIENGWWQDTVEKHFGEKMRLLWVYGIIVVPERPGETGVKGKRLVHPDFFEVTFHEPRLNRLWGELKRKLRYFDFMPKIH